MRDSIVEETTTTTTDKRALRELHDKRGNPSGEWLHETAKDNKIGRVTWFRPRPGTTDVLQKVALVTRIGDQVCAVGYYRPGHRGKEAIPLAWPHDHCRRRPGGKPQ